MTDLSTGLRVTVRYFAAARAAAGSDADSLVLGPGATISDLVGVLADVNPLLARVLARCSYLCDGIAVRDTSLALRSGQTIDVLPPFAGG